MIAFAQLWSLSESRWTVSPVSDRISCRRVRSSLRGPPVPRICFREVEETLAPRSFLKTLRNYGSFCATLEESSALSTFPNLRNDGCATLAAFAQQWSLLESRWRVPAVNDRRSSRRVRSSLRGPPVLWFCFRQVEETLAPRSFLKTLRNYGSFCATLAEYRRFSILMVQNACATLLTNIGRTCATLVERHW